MSIRSFASAPAAAVAFVLWGLLGVAMPAAAQVQTAVQYGWRSWWDYGGYSSFFVTSFPDEIAVLDREVVGLSGLFWERTGETFNVWSGPQNGALPTCRFFYWEDDWLDHFYTPYVAECAALRANPDWRWHYEGIAFYLQVPDENGNCPIATTILYRLYKGIADSPLHKGGPLHRLTTSATTLHSALDEGWAVEGDGRTFAFACVPSQVAP